jgi:capsular exopolysaccharide synthesis family protein
MNAVQDDPGLPDLRVLLRHPWSLVLGVVACVGAAVYYCRIATVRYQSTAQILVMQREPNPPAGSVAATGAVDEHVAKDLLGTHMQIIRSRKVLDRALEENGLSSLPSVRAALVEGQSPIEYVLENLVVSCGGEGQAQTAQVLNVSFKHTSSADVALILQSIVDVYQSFVREKFQDASQQAAGLIGKAKDEFAAELASKEGAYRKFRAESPQVGNDEASSLRQARLREIETSISEHRVRYAQLKARAEIVQAIMDGKAGANDLEKMASIGAPDIDRLSFLVDIERGDPVTQASRDQEVARYDQLLALRLETAKQLLGLRLEARKLEAQFGADNPGLLATREAIRELEEFDGETPNLVARESTGEVRPAELMQAYRDLLENDLREMDRRYEELSAQAAEERRALGDEVAAGITDEMMQRDLVLTRASYDDVARRLQDLNLIKDYNTLITEVISPVLPGEQVWPKALLMYAIGGFMGVLLGSAGALLLDVRYRRFRGAKDIEHTLRMSVLAHIPDLSARRNGGKGADPFLLAQQRPQSKAAEAFRRLRTALCFGNRAPGNFVIQVTSPQRGDGTTTLVTNLAVSMAQAGKRVLIVDTDLRNSRIHDVFGIEATPGLSNFLTEGIDPAEVIRATGCHNLFVIPGGTSAETPSELLSSSRLDELIGRVKQEFDFVLLDSPPLLDVSDALVVAARADGVLLQVRTTRKGRIAAVQACSRLGYHEVVGIAVRDSGSTGAASEYT